LADPQHGQNRVLLVAAVARSSMPRAREALAVLKSDPVLVDEIEKAVRRTEYRRRAES
jgi:hypothetical protein